MVVPSYVYSRCEGQRVESKAQVTPNNKRRGWSDSLWWWLKSHQTLGEKDGGSESSNTSIGAGLAVQVIALAASHTSDIVLIATTNHGNAIRLGHMFRLQRFGTAR